MSTVGPTLLNKNCDVSAQKENRKYVNVVTQLYISCELGKVTSTEEDA